MGLLTLNRNLKYHQGYYNPLFPNKYIGNGPIIFRSGLELKFMRWCDKTDTILKWSSESIAIPYFDTIQKKNRKYYADNFVEILEGVNIKRYLVEIKPFKQTQAPIESKGKKRSNLLFEQMQWVNNNDKWRAAKNFAISNGMDFIIITEKELNQRI
jgi:hypothetical protein